MALNVESWPIDKFIEYPNNPRSNNHVVDRFAGIIKEFGFRVPILAKSDGLIVDGHFRLKAAKKIGMTELPVILCDDMSDAQIKAFRLSVNKAAELADWDEDLLALELEALKELDFDIDAIGFDEGEINGLLGNDDSELQESETAEIDPESFEFAHECPKCGFGWNE